MLDLSAYQSSGLCSYQFFYAGVYCLTHSHNLIRRDIKSTFYPHTLTYQAIPLAFTLLATLFTGFGSWSCEYFSGARIGFVGDTYGLWTLEDINGKCQLWDVLFFSYNLDIALVTARGLSMSAMFLGLAVLTTMSLGMQYHIVIWGIGLIFLTLLIVSMTTTNIFNVWIIFWLFTYLFFILITRAIFIHPVHRRITLRGSKYIAICMIMCMLFTLLTLVVLSSPYCTCKTLAAGQLGGRIVGDPCEGSCHLESGGYAMILSSMLWLLSAIATQKINIQPQEIHMNPKNNAEMYGGLVEMPVTARRKVFIRPLTTRTRSPSGSSPDSESVALSRKLSQHAYEITEPTRLEIWRSWLSRATLFVVLIIYAFILLLFIGSRVENTKAERAPDTSPNFILDPVCAFNPLNPSQAFETFPTADDAGAAGLTVAHCGPCGFCSNMADIETYVETRKTVAASAKLCGSVAVLGSYDDLVNCLEEKIHFSRPCTVCWADNMKSTASHCLFTCMKTLFTGFMSSNNVPDAGQPGWLNHCLQCDEKLSGTAFVTCSGVARRRLGIPSEIERNPEEQCATVGVDWVSYF